MYLRTQIPGVPDEIKGSVTFIWFCPKKKLNLSISDVKLLLLIKKKIAKNIKSVTFFVYTIAHAYYGHVFGSELRWQHIICWVGYLRPVSNAVLKSCRTKFII